MGFMWWLCRPGHDGACTCPPGSLHRLDRTRVASTLRGILQVKASKKVKLLRASNTSWELQPPRVLPPPPISGYRILKLRETGRLASGCSKIEWCTLSQLFLEYVGIHGALLAHKWGSAKIMPQPMTLPYSNSTHFWCNWVTTLRLVGNEQTSILQLTLYKLNLDSSL